MKIDGTSFAHPVTAPDKEFNQLSGIPVTLAVFGRKTLFGAAPVVVDTLESVFFKHFVNGVDTLFEPSGSQTHLIAVKTVSAVAWDDLVAFNGDPAPVFSVFFEVGCFGVVFVERKVWAHINARGVGLSQHLIHFFHFIIRVGGIRRIPPEDPVVKAVAVVVQTHESRTAFLPCFDIRGKGPTVFKSS